MKWIRTLAAGALFTCTGWTTAQERVISVDPVRDNPVLYGHHGSYGEPGLGSTTGYGPGAAPTYGPGGYVPQGDVPVPQGRPRPFFNSHGLCCNSHHTWFGCGNFRSEFTWAWGSCRTFFGEACVPKPEYEHPLLNGAGAGGGGGLFRRSGTGIFGRLFNHGCSSCQ